jgi:hypothetical protein
VTDELVNGAAPAAEPAELPPASPLSSSEAAPAQPPASAGAAPLTPYQKRKAKETAAAAAAAERKRKRLEKAAKKPAAPAATAPGKKTDPEDEDDERDDAARAREAALFWRFVFRVVNLCAWPFGYRVDKLEKDEASEDAAYLVPLARRYAWFDATIRWAALPFVLAERIASHVKKRDQAKGATK